MTRKSLSSEIEQLDRRLLARRETIAQRRGQLTAALAHTHPWRLVAVGLVAGAATGAIGWRMGYAVTRMVYLLTARVSDAEPMG